MAKSCILTLPAGDVILDGRKSAFLPESRTLLVGDLHFEKASFLQMNGHVPLPSYDTDDTLARLETLITDYEPKHVAVLGDSFHDEDAGARLSKPHFERINALARRTPKFTWILGNHDPSIPKGLHGDQQDHLSVDGFLLTHLPTEGSPGEVNICGHLHPKLRFKIRRRSFSKPCFASADNRLILPSFGTFTGGLYADHPAIASELSGRPSFHVADDGEIFKIGRR